MTEELVSRLKGAGILIVLLLVSIFLLGEEATFLVALAAGLLGWREFARMAGLRDRPALHIAGYAWITLSFLYGFFINPGTIFWIWVSFLTSFGVIAVEHFLALARTSQSDDSLSQPHFDPAKTWDEMSRFVLGTIYIYMIFGFCGPIMSRPFGPELIILTLVAVSVNDTSAYFGGKRYGKRKVWPALSPGKTVAGVYLGYLGSILGTLFAWYLFYLIKDRTVSIWTGLSIGLIAAPLAVLGDFLESLLKRASHTKDSGWLLPGHGGILDRADAYVFVFPLIYFLF
jgi:phosphatidate cytidylyltransferase